MYCRRGEIVFLLLVTLVAGFATPCPALVINVPAVTTPEEGSSGTTAPGLRIDLGQANDPDPATPENTGAADGQSPDDSEQFSDTDSDTTEDTGSIAENDSEGTTGTTSVSDDFFSSGGVSAPAENDPFAENADKPDWYTIRGFVENEHFQSLNRDLAPENSVIKNEMRGRLEFRAGGDYHYVFSIFDFYMQPVFLGEAVGANYVYAAEPGFNRDGSFSRDYFEFVPREAWVNLSNDIVRARAGVQRFKWGTADVVNPTSYFNSLDLREMIFRDDDESVNGVPSASAMIFLPWFSIEAVVALVHVPARLPANGTIWDISPDDEPVDIYFADPDGQAMTASNYGYGIRAAGSFHGVDMSLSAYRGPDVDPFIVPEALRYATGKKVALELSRKYAHVSKLGADVSFKFDRFVFQAEVAYTPDKQVLVMQYPESITDYELPFETETSQHIAYACGFNYYLPFNLLVPDHEGTTVLTVDWNQSLYLDRDHDETPLSGLLSVRYEDSYLDDRLKLSFTVVSDPRRGGYMTWPQIGWDFQNGLRVDLGYVNINGTQNDEELYSTDNSLFWYLRDHDFVSWKVRYAF